LEELKWGMQFCLQLAFQAARVAAQLTARGKLKAAAQDLTTRRHLVEMLIVITIIGLIVAVTFPAFSSGIDSVRMSSATGMTSSFLNSAVNRAERRQQAVALIVSPKDN
jgi:hypothetical protein